MKEIVNYIYRNYIICIVGSSSEVSVSAIQCPLGDGESQESRGSREGQLNSECCVPTVREYSKQILSMFI